MQPELRIAVGRAVSLETGTPIRRLGCPPGPEDMQTVAEGGISAGEAANSEGIGIGGKKKKKFYKKTKE